MSVYAERYLRLDLGTGDWHHEPIAEDQARKWFLGSGLAAKLFFDEMDPDLEPLDPKSPLLIFNGLLSGTFAPTGCRSSWCGRSPLTGLWGEANLGNFWGAELRFSGLDGLVITGRATDPVYLWIDGINDKIELRDASHLWGKDYFETADQLLEETDPRARVAGIGQAGERLGKIAGVMSGPSTYVRAAARVGMGAVMGSKNLKAIVVRGNSKPDYPDLQRFRDVVREQNRFIKTKSLGMSTYGTSGGVLATEAKGDLPIRNWRLGNWSEVEKVSGQTIHDTIKLKHGHCFACPIGCGHEEEVTEGEFQSPRGKGLEYETIAGFGGNCQVSDLGALSLVNSLCNRYGLDTISTSAVIAFAMEAFEKGLVDVEQTGGVELGFGNPAAMVAMVHKIALREDLGQLLGEGVRTAAEALGGDAADMAVYLKRLGVADHFSPGFVSMAGTSAPPHSRPCYSVGREFLEGIRSFFPAVRPPNVLPIHKSVVELA